MWQAAACLKQLGLRQAGLHAACRLGRHHMHGGHCSNVKVCMGAAAICCLPISWSPRSMTSPSCTTTVSPPHHSISMSSLMNTTFAMRSDSMALRQSPCRSPTAHTQLHACTHIEHNSQYCSRPNQRMLAVRLR